MIEENWQLEVKELLGVVSRLQEENKRLKENVRSEKHAAVAEITAQRQGKERWYKKKHDFNRPHHTLETIGMGKTSSLILIVIYYKH